MKTVKRQDGLRVTVVDPVTENHDGIALMCFCDGCGSEGELSMTSPDRPRYAPPTCPNCRGPLHVAVEAKVRVFKMLDAPVEADALRRALGEVRRVAEQLALHGSEV